MKLSFLLAAFLGLGAWVLGGAHPAGATPGDLDYAFAGFGTGGVIQSSGATAEMAVAPDGKVVIAGHEGIGLVIRRYRVDGSPDPAFHGDGVANLLNPSFAMRATAVTVQPDGKIVVAGWAEAQTDDFLLARVTATGTLDLSFGSGGYVTIDFAGQTDQAQGVIVQSDGKIVVAGTAAVGGDDDFAVARCHPNGALDASFSGDGKITIGFGGDDAAYDLALQEDGKVVVVGSHQGFSDQDFALARLHVDGTLDDTFHFDGKVTVGLDGTDTALAVAIQPDGKIVVAGSRDASDGVMARLHSSGLLDDSLDGDGKMTAADGQIEDVVIQPDGRIVLVGYHWAGPDLQVAVHRLQPGGTPDATFAGDGRAYLDLGIYDRGHTVALLPDGRILAHATTGPDVLLSAANGTFLVQLWQDGTLDSGGHQALGYPESFLGAGANERVAGMVVQPDGKILVVGEISNAAGTESDIALARFEGNGRLDTSFGIEGRTTFSFHNADVARAIALQSDGKIVVAGHTGSGNGINFLVVRFEADGSLDTDFGFFGYNVLDFLGGADYAQALAIAPDGKIVMAGTVYNGARYVYGVCRFTDDGLVDPSFDVDGKQLHEIFFGATHWATSVVVQDDLKIVVGGQVGFDFALARYRDDGQVDFGWGPGGQGYSVVDMGGDDYLGALTMAVGGWFYAAGNRTIGPNSDFALAQFQPNGVLASCSGFPCFNWATGKAYVDWGVSDYAYAIDWRSDGQVVAAGCSSGQLAWAQFTTQSSNGPWLAQSNVAGEDECAQAVRFTGINRILTAGYQQSNGNLNFELSRFETSPNSQVTSVDPTPESGPSVLGFRLHGIHPNPSSSQSVVDFELAQAQPVRICLYDAAGRRVRTLVDGPMPLGRHQRTWDGRDDGGQEVAAGVYYVQATAGTAQAREKILRLR